jgi:phosphoglycolate phosphatase
VHRLLVLWDVDHTLVDSDGVGRDLYQATFGEMFGGPMPQPGSMAGRTDRAIALEVLTLAGVDEPRRYVDAFHRAMAARAPGLAGLVAERARALPGAAQAMAALAELGWLSGADGSGGPGGLGGSGGPGDGQAGRIAVAQSLLTGNIRPLAEVKLRPLGLTEHLDLDAGAYGDAHEVRAELVHLARANAARQYGCDFGGQATVLVGDTPLDVAAALATGARAVGVATGGFSGPQLAASGAHAVLPDLSATDQVLAAILGPHAS